MTLDELPDRIRVQIEVPKGSRIKRAPDGGIDFISPFPSPFNYGSVPETVSEDGEPLDAVVLGGRLPLGHSGDYHIIGLVTFIDGGDADPKVICTQGRWTLEDQRTVESFFKTYARLKGPLNKIRGRFGTTEYRGLALRESP